MFPRVRNLHIGDIASQLELVNQTPNVEYLTIEGTGKHFDRVNAPLKSNMSCMHARTRCRYLQ
jgi:hypothetical protein